MSKLYIHFQPNSYESFLNIFDLVVDTGDIAYYLHNYNQEKLTALDLYKEMCFNDFNIFGVSYAVPHLVNKMNIEVLEEENNHYVVLQLCPFLGLPGREPEKELNELKLLLIWVKEQNIKNPLEQINLQLSRDEEKAKLKLVSSSPLLEQELNKQFYEKINYSNILKEWMINQKLGLLEIDKEKKELIIEMKGLSLASIEEKSFINNIKNKNKIINKNR